MPIPPARSVTANNVFIKRTVVLDSIIQPVTTTWQAYPYIFAINRVPSYSEMASLFSEYKINAVKLTFTPFWDGSDAQNQWGSNTIALPRVYTLIDKNGISPGVLATENQFLEYGTAVQMKRPQEPFSIYVKNPQAEGAAAIGGGFTGNAIQVASPWLDTLNLNIEHHGAAIGIAIQGGSGTGTAWGYHVTATYYFQFKNAV